MQPARPARPPAALRASHLGWGKADSLTIDLERLAKELEKLSHKMTAISI